MSKVTQKHFRQPFRPSKVPLRPAGGYFISFVTLSIKLFRYSCLHIFQISTVWRSNQIPFSCWIHLHSCPYPLIIDQHLKTFSTVKSRINPCLMPTTHICYCYCYILIFPVSLYLSPFFTTIKFTAVSHSSHSFPSAPYQLSPCLLLTGA